MCGGGDQDAALEVIDRLAGKSLVAAEPAEDGTRYRLLDTVRYYAADRLAEAGGTEAARDRHAAAFVSLAERERELAVLAREQDNFRAALEWSLARGDPAGPRLARALGDFWLGRGLLAEGRDWLDRALALRPADQRLRADLLRLLGAVLFEAGELQGAQAVLSDGFQVAAAGAPAVQARIRALLADVRYHAGRWDRRDAGGMRGGRRSPGSRRGPGRAGRGADLAGRLRVWLGYAPATWRSSSGRSPAPGKAAITARRCARVTGWP